MIRYLLADHSQSGGRYGRAFVKQANDFWLAHFFTNEYCAFDQPNPGRRFICSSCGAQGLRLFISPAAITPRMGEGTEENLKRNRFPVNQSMRD